MAEIPLPDDITTLVRDLERRVRMLETRPFLPVRASWSPTQNQSNLSWATLPNGPSVTALIGPSRQAFVTVVCDMGLNQANQTGYLGWTVDGVNFFNSAWLSITSSSVTYPAATVGSTRLATNLPSGSVTFTAASLVSTGNVNYSNVDIVVQPC